ncbi:hypothetical protein ACFL6I_07920 [candidate division KSB1 bacterium]
MARKKAQAAMEFLMTYGWAILVVLVVIGALAYFGVLDPAKLLPDKCTATAGFSCADYTFLPAGPKVKLVNGMGQSITVTSAIVTPQADDPCTADLISTDTVVSAGGTLDLVSDCTATDGQFTVGDKGKASIEISYYVTDADFAKTMTVDVSATVQ